MKPRSTPQSFTAAVLTVCSIVPGAAESVVSPTHAPTSSAAVPAGSGLVNDWLREQSAGFNEWDFGGQFRVRYEIKEDGGSFPNRDFRRTSVDNDNSYLLIREKVHLGYTPVSWLAVYFEGRDSSSTGDDRNPNPEADQFDLHQAFVRIGDAKAFPLTTRIGRQELVYGDERLIGNGDWGNIPRAFDAAKLRFEITDFWVDGFLARVVIPDNHNFNQANDYDWFSGIYASTTKLIPQQETQLYLLSRNSSAKAASAQAGSLVGLPGARDVYTFGLRVKSLASRLNGWDYGAELAGQLGGINLSVPGAGNRRLEHEALAASVGGGYTWTNAFGAPRVGLEYNFASGDRDPTDGKNETFENLFPTNHKHYGYMDFMGWRNIHNPRLNASIKPARTINVTVDYHLFWLADGHDFFYPETGSGRGASGSTVTGEPPSYGRNPQFSSFVGSEVDLDIIYSPTRWAMLRTGYGHFFVGDYVKRSLTSVGGAVDADWVYFQATVSF